MSNENDNTPDQPDMPEAPPVEDMGDYEPINPDEAFASAPMDIDGSNAAPKVVVDNTAEPKKAEDLPGFRTLPHNIEAEKALLGAIFTDNKRRKI